MNKNFNHKNYIHYDINNWKQFSGYGIYGIYNNANDKLYIGCSTKNIGIRISHHLSRLKTNHHTICEMQKDWNDGHLFTLIIFELNNDDIHTVKQEQLYIKSWYSILYNTTQQIIDFPQLTSQQITKFWSYIQKYDDTQCWPWTHNINRQGYGRIGYNYKRYPAHRLAYCLHNKVILHDILGLVIRHTCDNPICCNPNHLILGTVKDNADDRSERNICRKSQFTQKDVEQMIQLRQQGLSGSEIAKIFKVRSNLIYDTLSGKVKSTQQFLNNFNHIEYNRKIKSISQNNIEYICEMSKIYSSTHIANIYNISPSHLRRILHGKIKQYILPKNYNYATDRYKHTR